MGTTWPTNSRPGPRTTKFVWSSLYLCVGSLNMYVLASSSAQLSTTLVISSCPLPTPQYEGLVPKARNESKTHTFPF
uniref:Uncharacterized protein n=1 Tax=Arundo donax TaxID=35708 RepID=A0A0A8ZCE8_ARUDO